VLRMFEPEGQESTEGQGKLHSEEFHNLCFHQTYWADEIEREYFGSSETNSKFTLDSLNGEISWRTRSR